MLPQLLDTGRIPTTPDIRHVLLTLQQAADALGKTARQVRYLVKQGRLPARKVGGQWLVDSADLPRSPGQDKATERKQRMLVQAIDEALDIPASARRRYSVRDLRAYKIAAPLYHQITAALGAEHPVCQALHQTLEELARGCHRYDRTTKADAYRTARDHASQAACQLALLIDRATGQKADTEADLAPDQNVQNVDNGPALAWLDTVEQELMAALAGLIRRLERQLNAA